MNEEKTLNETIAQFKTGTILQFHGFKRIYIVVNRTVRPFPNRSLFLKLGLDVTDIEAPSVKLSKLLHEFFPIGDPIPDTTDENKSHVYVTRLKNRKAMVFLTP